MKNSSELIQEMYKSKQWSLPDALKEKTVPEINDLLIYTLADMMTDDPHMNLKEYNDMAIQIKVQLNEPLQAA